MLDEDRWLFWLKALGWGLPIIPMLPYVAFRLAENLFSLRFSLNLTFHILLIFKSTFQNGA